MNNVIEFKKDCIMKTRIEEITDISLSHDYKILEDTIEGYFDVSGEYKLTKASLQKEEFTYTIPFTIGLSSLIDRNSINLTIKDFKYETEKDVLHLKMYLNMEYQEIVYEEPIPEPIEIEEPILEEPIEQKEEVEEVEVMEIKEEESDTIMNDIEEMLNEASNLQTPQVFHNEVMLENIESETKEVKENLIHTELNESDTEVLESIMSNTEESFYKYKIYIMREEDTIESIAIKYNVTLDDLKEYNDLSNINIGDKIIIPFTLNEQD